MADYFDEAQEELAFDEMIKIENSVNPINQLKIGFRFLKQKKSITVNASFDTGFLSIYFMLAFQ